MNKVAGVVVAGGKSSRMGKDKMYLTYQGQNFIDLVVDSLSACNQVFVVLNDQQQYEHEGTVIVRDTIKEIGPMGGLHAALNAMTQDYVYLCGCDMPHHSKAFVNYVLSYVEEDLYDAYIVCTPDGKMSPFGSVYHKRVHNALIACIANGQYRMMDFIKTLHTKKIYLDYTSFDAKHVLANINTPEDYQTLQIPPFIAISGSKNSGKTTLVVKLIEYFKKEGLKVGTIKHDGHVFEADIKGTDSYRHKQAGASRTLVYDQEKMCLVQDLHQEDPLRLLAYFKGMDLVLLEGFKGSDYPKIEVVRKLAKGMPVCASQTVLAYATDCPLETTIDQYGLDDVEALSKVIKRYLEESRKPHA